MNDHHYGYIQDPEDERDFLFTSSLMPQDLPPSLSLRKFCSPVRNQQRLSACTGFAVATGLREYMLTGSGCPVTLSPKFLYWHSRNMINATDQDSGARIRDTLKVLTKIGVCTEATDPYDIRRFTETPVQSMVDEASNYKIKSYHREFDIMGIKQSIFEFCPVVMGMMIYESMESREVAFNGKLSMPQPGEKLLGGHAVFIIGYEDDPNYEGGGYLTVKNSWGDQWGDSGYFFLPYSYISPERTPDLWITKD